MLFQLEPGPFLLCFEIAPTYVMGGGTTTTTGVVVSGVTPSTPAMVATRRGLCSSEAGRGNDDAEAEQNFHKLADELLMGLQVGAVFPKQTRAPPS